MITIKMGNARIEPAAFPAAPASPIVSPDGIEPSAFRVWSERSTTELWARLGGQVWRERSATELIAPITPPDRGKLDI